MVIHQKAKAQSYRVCSGSDGCLLHNPDTNVPRFAGRFLYIMEVFAMDYMLISEASKKRGITSRRIQTLCSEERINGTNRLGRLWVIPKGARKPADARIKSGKYIKGRKEQN